MLKIRQHALDIVRHPHRVADEGARIERQYLVALLDLACRLAIVGDLDGPGHVERCGASRGKRLGA